MINLGLSITVHACWFALGIIITIACLSFPANIASPVKLQQIYFSFPSFCHCLTYYGRIKEHFSGACIDIFIIFQMYSDNCCILAPKQMKWFPISLHVRNVSFPVWMMASLDLSRTGRQCSHIRAELFGLLVYASNHMLMH